MRRPYTHDFPRAATLANVSVAATFTAVLWSRPLRTPLATTLLALAVWLAALSPHAHSLGAVLHMSPGVSHLLAFEVSAALATAAAFLNGPRWFGAGAVFGQLALLVFVLYARDSTYELAAAHLFLYGLLYGAHLFATHPPDARQAPERRSFPLQDASIAALTLIAAAFVTERVFAGVVGNGDEISNTFQADLFAHFRAYAPVPPCASMFENYWVFRHGERIFSQYTPGWPLFMAPFSRVGLVWLAGPTMAAIAAVGVARLSRRVATGLGRTSQESARIVAVAGPLGAACAMLGPSMLLNGASRFPHVMVCACFVWAIESLCILCDGVESRRAAWRHGAVLGAAVALGIAARPADGALVAVGVALYAAWALWRGKLPHAAVPSAALGFLLFAGLTAVILRLQLGTWFKTGYSIAASIRPEAVLKFSFPGPRHLKEAVPLATGSYTWWPAAPALGVAGLLQALHGKERRTAFMLLVGGFAQHTFYFFVAFGRAGDNGLGPRYLLPLVVPMAAGGAALLAPLLAAAWERRQTSLREAGPALVALVSAVAGVALVVPLVYPVAREEYANLTAPVRGAARLGLKHAVVAIEPERVSAHPTNLAQNAPMDPNPDVLFLIRRSAADEACARAHFPGRDWYHAGKNETLEPY